MRGGVSKYCIYFQAGQRSSPHAWGCFSVDKLLKCPEAVFPTCVGVFLSLLLGAFPLTGLPHMRGGVSHLQGQSKRSARSSPHAWGCFSRTSRPASRYRVFPTCVGVFPIASLIVGGAGGLPHMRGGVSPTGGAGDSPPASSPHAWGCFRCGRLDVDAGFVFPTHVGVFPSLSGLKNNPIGLPHIRGGVSSCRHLERRAYNGAPSVTKKGPAFSTQAPLSV